MTNKRDGGFRWRYALILLTVTCFVGLVSINSHAATYYIPNDFSNLQAAFARMSGGDTLVIKSGTYTGSSNAITNNVRPPRGSTGSYTTIRAEVDGGVIFDGQNVRNMFTVSTGTTSYTDHYWKFEGIEWKNTPDSNVGMNGGAHVKFLRCGFSQDNADGAGANAYMRYSQYILFEDCYAYGGKRYKFQFAAGSDTAPTRYNIFRRCVARLDNVHASDNIGGFIFYSSRNCEAQNCIVIDSNMSSDWTYALHQGSFGVPATMGPSTNHFFRGNIALNNHFGGFFTASNDVTSATYINNICWDTGAYNNGSGGRPNWFRGGGYAGARKELYNFTFGVCSGDGSPGVRAEGNEIAILKNSIITRFAMSQAVGDIATQNYNAYYANNYNGNAGKNDVTNVNILAASLRYLPRIEDGSPLKGRGENGADIGANVLKRIGVSGTLYSEPGYNETTNINLWPFPNEDLIRSKMRAYNYNVDGVQISGRRGFCADGQTLTKYIWEYLGNPIPPVIYGSQGDVTPPESPTGIDVQVN